MFRNFRTAILMALGLGLFCAASADAATLTLSTGADPAESIATQLSMSGTTTNSQTGLEATIKPTGGQGCGVSDAADSGQDLFFGSDVAEGPFSQSINHTFQSAGSYLLCAWLDDNSASGDPVVAAASLTFTVRAPHLALSISAPATVRPGQTFQIATTAQAEVSRSVSEYVLPNTGRGCPANGGAADQASGSGTVYWPTRYSSSWNVEGGPFTESVNETLRSPGQYLICAYVQYPSDESPPEITANATVVAAVPLPHCVVPRISAGTSLAGAKSRILRAHCAVGRVRSVRSRRYRRGRALRLNARAGQVLPYHAALEIVVSRGRR
jgi:hypothetical protein